MRCSLNRKAVQIASLLSLVFLFSFQEKEAVTITWKDLSEVTYKNKFSLKCKCNIEHVYPSSEIRTLDKKEIQIKGIIIPLDTYGEQFFLSSKVNPKGHFCSNEIKQHEFIHLKLKHKPANFILNDSLTFKGTFNVNTKDINELLYTLENAELVK